MKIIRQKAFIFLFFVSLLNAQTKDSSAILQLNSTTQGMLIPRMTSNERDAIANPADGLMIYNTDNNGFDYYSSAGSNWEVFGDSSIKGDFNVSIIDGLIAQVEVINTYTEVLNISFESSDLTFDNSEFSVTSVSDDFEIIPSGQRHTVNYTLDYSSNGTVSTTVSYNYGNFQKTENINMIIKDNLIYYEFVSQATGEIWLDRNMGAISAPNDINDTGSNFGDHYTWNDANTVCPGGFRLPTQAEWSAEINALSAMGQLTVNGFWDNLHLTQTGYRSSSVFYSGQGRYWSSTEANSTNAYSLSFTTSGYAPGVYSNLKASEYSVRCIKDD